MAPVTFVPTNADAEVEPPRGPVVIPTPTGEESFFFVPKLGSKVMRHMAEMGRHEAALFDTLRALSIDADTYDRIMDLDLSGPDLFKLLDTITDLYGMTPGESPASESPSSDAEAS